MDTKIISTPLNKGQLGTAPGAQAQRVAVKAGASEASTARSSGTETTGAIAAAEFASAQPLEQIVNKLNTQALTSNHTLRFSVDDTLGKPVISVVDKETDEVIRQIPPETAIKIAETFAAVTSGSLLSESA